MNEVEWRTIPDFPGYRVSSDGQVWSDKSNRVLKADVDRDGHHRVSPFLLGVRKRIFVHRLMALAFLPNPENLPVVRHLNDVPGDNRVENLAWGTHSDNTQDAVKNGGHRNVKKTHCAEGHEYSDDNIQLFRGYQRRCKVCSKKWAKVTSSARKARGLEPEDPRHGTLTGYTSYACRCEACRQAARDYDKSRAARNKRGVEKSV